MKFEVRRAEEQDIPMIMDLIMEAKENVPDPDWFEAEDMEFAGKHIDEEGFTILAQWEDRIAGMMMVRIPGEQEDNLGEYLNLTDSQRNKTAHLEIAVVAPEFQGNGLQYRLFCMAEERLREQGYDYLMATVHPENRYSLRNMERLGMVRAAEVRKYGGKPRYVMWKRI